MEAWEKMNWVFAEMVCTSRAQHNQKISKRCWVLTRRKERHEIHSHIRTMTENKVAMCYVTDTHQIERTQPKLNEFMYEQWNSVRNTFVVYNFEFTPSISSEFFILHLISSLLFVLCLLDVVLPPSDLIWVPLIQAAAHDSSTFLNTFSATKWITSWRVLTMAIRTHNSTSWGMTITSIPNFLIIIEYSTGALWTPVKYFKCITSRNIMRL